MTRGVIHWDGAARRRTEFGPFRGEWTDLGRSSGTKEIGVRRLQLDPGARSTPVHVHTAEEEIFFVLAGNGLSWQDEHTHEIAAGDCLVHLPGREAHTLIAGTEGLDAVVFSTRVPVEACRLPRAGVSWLGPSWVTSGEGAHPFAREAALELPLPEPSERPSSIASLPDIRVFEIDRGSHRFSLRDLARAARRRRPVGTAPRHPPSGEVVLPPPLPHRRGGVLPGAGRRWGVPPGRRGGAGLSGHGRGSTGRYRGGPRHASRGRVSRLPGRRPSRSPRTSPGIPGPESWCSVAWATWWAGWT